MNTCGHRPNHELISYTIGLYAFAYSLDSKYKELWSYLIIQQSLGVKPQDNHRKDFYKLNMYIYNYM
jgi:hypothetical protein